MRKKSLLGLLFFTSVVGIGNHASADTPLTRSYKNSSRTITESRLKESQNRFIQGREAAKPVRNKFVAELDRMNPGLWDTIQSEAKSIMASRMSLTGRQKALKDLLDRNRPSIQKAMGETASESRMYRSTIRRIFTGYLCSFDAYLNVYCSDIIPVDATIDQDILFQSPFSDSETSMSAALIGFGTAQAIEFHGEVDAEAVAIDAGSFFAQAGMVETVTVPPGVDRVKVTANIETDYSQIAFALLGISGGDVFAYLNVYGDNQIKCNVDRLLSMVIAPVAFYMNNAGSKLSTITCEFTPNSTGGDYVVAGGSKATAFAALPAATMSDAAGDVRDIKVEFISE